MKNLRQSITLWDYMVMLYLMTLSTPLLSSNLCSVHLSSGIPYNMIGNFSIHSSKLHNKKFLIIGFINELIRNLSTLCLIVSEFAK